MLGLERSLGSRIVTYADDLVILCRRGKGEEALARMRELMGKLKLTVNRCHSLGGRNRRAARAGDRHKGSQPTATIRDGSNSVLSAPMNHFANSRTGSTTRPRL